LCYRTAIDVFLLGTIIYQFFPNGRRVIVEGISWRFSLLGIASAIYLNLWMHHYHTLDFIFSAVSFVTATHLYYLLKKNYPSRSLVDEICIHLPFSLYHSWSTFLVLLSAFEAFGSRRQGMELAGPWTKMSVFLVFVFLELTAISYTFSTPEGDFPASLIICLCLFAVFGQQQSSAFIHGFALGFAILSILWAVKSLYGLVLRYRNLLGIGVEDPERAPLVGGV
jgi:hypothetical protein